MIRLYFITFVLVILVINIGYSQKKTPSDFIPNGYRLFEQYSGDLNKDDSKDYVLIIKNTRKENLIEDRFGDRVDRNRRGVIVILGKENNLEKIVENKDCFLSENEDGGVYMPPELWINIEDEKLKIHYGHGRYGYWEYIFKYLENDFKLIGYEASENHGPKVLYQTSIDFLKKEKLLSENMNKNSEDEEDTFEVISYKLQIDDLIRLSEIKEFEEFDISKF